MMMAIAMNVKHVIIPGNNNKYYLSNYQVYYAMGETQMTVKVVMMINLEKNKEEVVFV